MTRRTDAPWSPDPDAEAELKTRLGENIRLLRARIFISQEELASRADIHRTQISLLESGRQQPLIGTTMKLPSPSR